MHDNLKLLLLAMSSIAEGVICINNDSKIEFINQAALKLTGWGENEAMRQPLHDVFNIIDVKTREKADGSFTKVLSIGKEAVFSEYMVLITRSGSNIYISAKASPIKNQEGQVSGVIITFQDVTYHRQYEEELRIERNNLRTQFQYAPVGMVIVDENSVIQSANDQYSDMFENLNNSVIGKKLGASLGCAGTKNSICAEDEQCTKCIVRECIYQVTKSRIPFRNVEKCCRLIQNGRTVIRNLKFNLVPISINGSIHVLISVDDMTRYRVMEDNIRKSRDFCLTLFNDFPALIWRSRTDKRIDYINKRWLEFTGKTLEHELGDGRVESIHPDDLDTYVKKYAESFDKHEPFEIEYRLKRFDGEYRWIIDRAGPYYDLDGSFAGFVGACYDITEQKQARDVLKRYELLSEKASDIILFININGGIIEANEAAVKTYGYKRQELLSRTIYDLRKDRDLAKIQLEKAFESGIFYESTHYRKDGSSLPVEVSSQSTILGDSKVVISIVRDITQRKQVELEMNRAMEATKAAYRAKSEFLANMSHEIRTPLNGLIGMLYLTMLTNLTNEQMDNLSTAKVCADSLLKIINDILDLSKMEAGKMNIELEEFDYKVLIEKIVKVHQYRANEKGLQLTYQLPDDLPSYIVGDPNRLQQVLNNLMSNAVKFTDRGTVSLMVNVEDYGKDFARLKFTIEDTGIGISRDEMDKLFKSFSQVDSSQTRRFGGTGLGLVISRQLIEMMGGTLSVESEKGNGSIFSFILRFEVGKKCRTAADNSERGNIIRTKTNARVLLVEDDTVNQEVICRMLKEIGYRCDVASCGSDALLLLEKTDYELCLMDIQMTGMDGIQATAVIRENEKKTGKHLPVIALTAHALQGDRERLLSIGMDEYIAKPFQMSELYDIMEKLIKGHYGYKDNIVPEYNSHMSAVITKSGRNAENCQNDIKPALKEIDSNIESLRLVINTVNMQGIERIAHDIKILASSIGADKIKTLAFRIELAARRGNLTEVMELFTQLDELFQVFC